MEKTNSLAKLVEIPKSQSKRQITDALSQLTGSIIHTGKKIVARKPELMGPVIVYPISGYISEVKIHGQISSISNAFSNGVLMDFRNGNGERILIYKERPEFMDNDY